MFEVCVDAPPDNVPLNPCPPPEPPEKPLDEEYPPPPPPNAVNAPNKLLPPLCCAEFSLSLVQPTPPAPTVTECDVPSVNEVCSITPPPPPPPARPPAPPPATTKILADIP